MTFEHEVSIVEIYRRCRQSQHFNYNASRYYMKWNNGFSDNTANKHLSRSF